MHVRQLIAADLAAYRALHRFGLDEASTAFVQSKADDGKVSDADVEAVLARGEAWGVFDGPRMLGKLVIDALPYAVLAHVRWLHAVYLHPEARGSAAGAMLVNAALDHAAANGARRFALWVSSANPAAGKFYAKLGFAEAGRIPGGIAGPGGRGFVDDILMVREVPGTG